MKETMKAAVLHAPNDLRYEDVPIPEIGVNEVLVKVTACGVCGSDIPRVLTQGTYHFPTIPGHEFGGIVSKLGSKVKQDLLGKKVAVIPLIPCRSCKMCETGQFAQCENYDFLGSRSNGGFAEYVAVPEENLVIVPENVDEDAVAFLEPISVALHVVQNCGVEFGSTVAVYGLGAIGIFIAQWAKAFGAKHVFAIDLEEQKVQIAKEIGLVDAICGATEDVSAIIKEKTNGLGVDYAFEAAGSGITFNNAIMELSHSGVLALVGRPTKSLEVKEAAYEKILRGQITIKGTWSFEFKRFPRHAWELGLQALEDKKIKTAPIISHRMPLEKTYDAIRIMADRNEFFYKILIKP